MEKYTANCRCGGVAIIRTKNAFRVPELLQKRGWRLIDPYNSSYDIKTNWRCPMCATAYEENPFEIPPTPSAKPAKTCRTCKHRERWARGGSIIQYCGVRKSNRTHNGLLKIKVTNPACSAYEKEIE